MDEQMDQIMAERDKLIQQWQEATDQVIALEKSYVDARAAYAEAYERAQRLGRKISNNDILKSLTTPPKTRKAHAKD